MMKKLFGALTIAAIALSAPMGASAQEKIKL